MGRKTRLADPDILNVKFSQKKKSFQAVFFSSSTDKSFRPCFRISVLRFRIPVFGFRIPDSGLRIPDSGFRIPNSGFQIPDSKFRIPNSGFQIPDSGFRIPDSGFRIPNSGFRIPNSGFWIPDSGFQLLGKPHTRHEMRTRTARRIGTRRDVRTSLFSFNAFFEPACLGLNTRRTSRGKVECKQSTCLTASFNQSPDIQLTKAWRPYRMIKQNKLMKNRFCYLSSNMAAMTSGANQELYTIARWRGGGGRGGGGGVETISRTFS